ncbi:MAG: hypothetical protein AB2745_08840 [Candidatus Thiodiazotropha endolucinida]
MLERPITKREAVSLATMLDTGLISYKHYMCWVDERIMLEDEPELWMLELAATKHSKTAICHLNSYAYSEPFEKIDSEACNDEFVAAEWLRYKRNEISWATFLLECGDHTDGNYAREDCEYFYYMLNDIEDSEYSISVENKQSNEVFKRFSGVIREIESKYDEFLPYLRKYRESYGA